MRKEKRILRYTVIFEEAEEGGYIVRVPTLGFVTQGETFEQAKAMVKDAIRAYCFSLLKHGEPIPEEGPTGFISTLSIPITLPAA